jgi:hypothetical protein
MRLTETTGHLAGVKRGETSMRTFAHRILPATVGFAIVIGAGAPALAGACTTGSKPPSPHVSGIHTAIAVKGPHWSVKGHHHGGVVTTSYTAPTFAQQQSALESQIRARQAELSLLTSEVGSSTVLSSGDAAALQADITAPTSAFVTLAASVPNDTTPAQLQADAATLKTDDNSLIVVQEQVTDTIRADRITARIAANVALEPTLQTGVTALVGTPNGARLAFYDANFVSLVTAAQTASSGVAAQVLAQTGADYPANSSVFAKANWSLTRASNDLAQAARDRAAIERGLI